jgi:hypothetical protein
MSTDSAELSAWNSMSVEEEGPVSDLADVTPKGWRAKCVNQCLIVFDPEERTAVIKSLDEHSRGQGVGPLHAEWSEGMDLTVLQRLCRTVFHKTLDLKASRTGHQHH